MSFEKNEQVNYKISTNLIILLVQTLLQEYAKHRKIFSSKFFVKRLFKSNNAVTADHIAVYTLKRNDTPESDVFIEWIAKDIPRLIKHNALSGISFELYEELLCGNERKIVETVMMRINYSNDNTKLQKKKENDDKNTSQTTTSYLETKTQMVAQMRDLVSKIGLLNALPNSYSISLKVLTNDNLDIKQMGNTLTLSLPKHESTLFDHPALFLDDNELTTGFHQFKLCLFSSLEKKSFFCQVPPLNGCSKQLSSSDRNGVSRRAELKTISGRCDESTGKNLNKFFDADVTAVSNETQLVCSDKTKERVIQDKATLKIQVLDNNTTLNDWSDEIQKNNNQYDPKANYQCKQNYTSKSKALELVSKKRKLSLHNSSLNLIETERSLLTKEISPENKLTMAQKSGEGNENTKFAARGLPKTMGKRKIIVTKSQLQNLNKKLNSNSTNR
ncbi:hypothetical protein ACO0RG_004248 [Hanseniaspora osmophila]